MSESLTPKRNAKGHFLPGSGGNPGGRPPMGAGVQALRNSRYDKFVNLLEIYFESNKAEIESELRKASLPSFSRIILVLVKAAAEGEREARRELFDRLWGKIKPIEAESDERPVVIIHKLDGTKVIMGVDNGVSTGLSALGARDLEDRGKEPEKV